MHDHDDAQETTNERKRKRRGKRENENSLLIVHLLRKMQRAVLVAQADRPAEEDGHGLVRCATSDASAELFQ